MTANHDIKLPPPTKLNLVIASNYKHYRYWFDHVLEEPGSYQYVKSPENLRGHTADKAQILLLDDWWEGRSHEEMGIFNREIDVLNIRGMEVHIVSSA